MRNLTPKEEEQVKEAMHNLGYESYFVFAKTFGNEVFVNFEGQVPEVMKLLGALCARSPDLVYLLLGAIRMAHEPEQIREMMAKAESEEILH